MFFGFGKKKETIVLAPISGKVRPLSSLQDETFRSGILGPGIAIVPEDGRVTAPADGTLSQMFDTGHAFSMLTSAGAELLVHVGLDTVRLKGKHFTRIGKTGDTVKAGDHMIDFDKDAVRGEGYDPSIVVVVLNPDHFKKIRFTEEEFVQAGSPLIWLESK
jgi:glucose-specific phosphotransferase system IIA component